MKFSLSYFAVTLVILLTEIFIAFYIRDAVIRPYGGDFLIVIFLYCAVKSFVPVNLFPTAAFVLVLSYLIEVCQFFEVNKILGFDKSQLARIIFGSQFSWGDLLAYTLGICFVLFVELKFNNKEKFYAVFRK